MVRALPPYFDMGERILTDLRAVGIRGKLQSLEGPPFAPRSARAARAFRAIEPSCRTSTLGPGAPRPMSASTPSAAAHPPSSASRTSRNCGPASGQLDLEERDRLIKAIQRTLIDEYYFVPIYWNPFVHAVGPKVLPARGGGKGFERYWDTLQAPYPWPWEVWEGKGLADGPLRER